MAQAPTLLHRWFEEVWNQQQESAIDELMADDALVHGIGPDGQPLKGRPRSSRSSTSSAPRFPISASPWRMRWWTATGSPFAAR